MAEERTIHQLDVGVGRKHLELLPLAEVAERTIRLNVGAEEQIRVVDAVVVDVEEAVRRILVAEVDVVLTKEHTGQTGDLGGSQGRAWLECKDPVLEVVEGSDPHEVIAGQACIGLVVDGSDLLVRHGGETPFSLEVGRGDRRVVACGVVGLGSTVGEVQEFVHLGSKNSEAVVAVQVDPVLVAEHSWAEVEEVM